MVKIRVGSLEREVDHYFLVAIAYLLIALWMFWPIVPRISSAVPGTGGDVFQSMWDLWWVPYATFTLRTSPYFTKYIFYPVGANLATQTLAPIAGFVSWIFQLKSLPLAFNFIFLLGFVLSGLFAFMLAERFAKNRHAAFIGGFIYAFSPIHIAQAFGHVQFTNIEFIPLFLLMLLKMAEDEGRKTKYAIVAGISFTLLTFMGDIQQGLMAILLAVSVLGYMLIDKTRRHKILNMRFAVLLGETAVVALVSGSPFIWGILTHLTPGVLSTVNAQAGLQNNLLYSPDLLSFFIPSSMNGPLSPISRGAAAIDAPASAERTTYIGYTVIFLVAFALAKEHREGFRNIMVVLVPLVLFLLLSLGPYLQINGNLTGVPGPYLIYRAIPFFNVLREPGRFDIVVELMLGILAAIGVEKLERQYSHLEIKRYIPLIVIVLLVIEYNAWPTSAKMLNSFYTLNATIPTPYYEIGRLPGNFTMLVLPALPNYSSTAPALYPGLALYYQTAFKKPLVGGYTTRFNTTQVYSLMNMPLVDSAYYLQTGQGLVYASPVKVNYTNVTKFLMAAYNVGFISIIRSAYNTSEIQQLASYLAVTLNCTARGTTCNPVVSNSTIIFSTTNIADTAGSGVVAYTPILFGSPYSIWQPGWLVCQNNSYCTNDYLNTWFGINPAYISLYSPNYTKMTVSLRALAPFQVRSDYVYFDGRLVSVLNLTPKAQNFSFNIGLNPGINPLIFVSPNMSQNASYTNIGIMNITFKKSS